MTGGDEIRYTHHGFIAVVDGLEHSLSADVWVMGWGWIREPIEAILEESSIRFDLEGDSDARHRMDTTTYQILLSCLLNWTAEANNRRLFVDGRLLISTPPNRTTDEQERHK